MDVLAHGTGGPYDEVLLLVPLLAVLFVGVAVLRKPKAPVEPAEPADEA